MMNGIKILATARLPSAIKISFVNRNGPCARAVAKVDEGSRIMRNRVELSQQFSGKGKTKFPKNALNFKVDPANKAEGLREVSGVWAGYEARNDSTKRVRVSPLRSHHNNSKNGMSESKKKAGPPRRWIKL